MSQTDGTDTVLAKLLSDMEAIKSSQQAVEAKVDAISDTLRVAAEPTPMRAYLSSVVFNGSHEAALLLPPSPSFENPPLAPDSPEKDLATYSTVPAQANANNAKSLTDLSRYTFTDNAQDKVSLTRLYDFPQNSSHSVSPTVFVYEPSASTSRAGPLLPLVPRATGLGAEQITTTESHEFPFESTMPSVRHRSPEPHRAQGSQDRSLRELNFEGYEHASTSPQYGPDENPAFDMYSLMDWDTSPVPPSISPRPSSSLKAPPTRARLRSTPRHQHHRYLDSLLRSKCPKDRLHALNVAIQFRDEHNAHELIPNDLLDELLEASGDDKYFCFCCPRGRKARTITPARDHVRKSLGNFPFQCSNSWCRHSSLRQADLSKHLKTCVNTASSRHRN